MAHVHRLMILEVPPMLVLPRKFELPGFELPYTFRHALLLSGAQKDHINVRILQTLVCGIPLILRLGAKM